VAVALHRLAGTPFEESARSALGKIVAVMPACEAVTAQALAARVHLIGDHTAPRALADGVSATRVLIVEYAD
jgi:hypothetical protein